VAHPDSQQLPLPFQARSGLSLGKEPMSASTSCHKKVRRARATKFPYALFFLVEADALLVIACFHGSRDPRQWQKRV
jgi:plasmid stabilization system protein ParE